MTRLILPVGSALRSLEWEMERSSPTSASIKDYCCEDQRRNMPAKDFRMVNINSVRRRPHPFPRGPRPVTVVNNSLPSPRA